MSLLATRAEATTTLEIPGLTTLRGLLAVWVVVYHFWADVLTLLPATRLLSPLAQAGNIAVPGFFMLSGLVMMHTYGLRMRVASWHGTRTFLALRLVRVYPVHLVTLLVVVAMVAVSHAVGIGLTDAGYTLRDFTLNLLLAHTWVPHFQLNWNYPSWSISSEWFVYCLFPFFVPIAMRQEPYARRIQVLTVVSLGASIVFMLLWPPRPFYEMLLVVPTFATGAWLAFIPARSATAEYAWWHQLPTLGAIVAVLACFVSSAPARIAIVLCCFVLTIAILFRARLQTHQVWAWRPAFVLGQVSYSLYMTHTLAQKVLYVVLPSGRYGSKSAAVRLAVLLAYLIAVALACLLTYRLVEEPARRTLKQFAIARFGTEAHKRP